MTYPDGFVVSYNYSSDLNDAISRLSSLSDTSGTLESYSYLGLGTVVIRGHSQPGVDLTYVKQSGESNGDAGDQYTGLDRFGRVVDQRWIKTSSGTATDRFQYGYDRDGNRLWRDNLVNSAFGELYSYDSLNQITSFDRGTLNANKNGISGSPTRQQGWDFDALGNFDSVTTDSSTQTRSHNDQNEITSISGATTPTYDANGNMTGDETGRKFAFDAWNRLVTVKDSSNNVLESFAYDAVNRRVSTTASSTTTDLYYSAEWQVLEERVSGNTTMQYVWSPVYIDAMILRDRDTDANGSLDERLWVQQDANFNVTALVNGSGSVVERYAYDPFGTATIYDASWGSRSSSSYAWLYLHQGGRFEILIGLYYFRYRDYSSAIGRWMQVDPEHISAGDMNFYRALGDRPTCLVDPMGAQPGAPYLPSGYEPGGPHYVPPPKPSDGGVAFGTNIPNDTVDIPEVAIISPPSRPAIYGTIPAANVKPLPPGTNVKPPPPAPPPPTGAMGGHHVFFERPKPGYFVGTTGANPCLGVIIRCPDGKGAVIHFACGVCDPCGTIKQYKWAKGCTAVVFGGGNAPVSRKVLRQLIGCLKDLGLKPEGFMGESAYVGSDGEIYGK